MGLLIAPAVANAGWVPAVDISAEGEFGFDQYPQIAVGAPGDAVAVWPQLEGHYVIQASTKIVGGAWGPPVDVSPPGEDSLEPRVAMNAAGQGVAVWIHRGSQRTVKAASRTPWGSWGSAVQVSIPGHSATDVDVAIDPAGNAVAIWTQYDETSDYIVEAATKSSGGQWEPAAELSEPGHNAWQPKLAVDPSGNIVAAWTRWNDSGDMIVQVAEKEAGGGWSEPVDLSAGGAHAISPKVQVSAERAVVIWVREEVIEGAVREAGGGWQEPAEISWPESGEPAIGMDASGDALALWSFDSEDGLIVEAATLLGGQAWTEPVILSEPQQVDVAQPRVAVDPVGRAIATWTGWNGTERVVEAATGAIGGGWGSPVTLSPPESWAHRAQVAMDSAGNAAVVWRAAEPLTMQAALFDVTKPELNAVSIPSLVRAGRPISFAATPFDAWSAISPASWTFGDASTAVGSSVAHSFQEAGQFHVTVTVTDAAGYSTTASGNVSVTPALAIANRIVAVRNGRARLKLHCPGTAICHGSARLIRRVKSRKDRRRLRSIGEAQFAIPAEAQTTVVVKLKTKGLNLFAPARRKGLRAWLTGDAVESRTVVLKPVGPRPRR